MVLGLTIDANCDKISLEVRHFPIVFGKCL